MFANGVERKQNLEGGKAWQQKREERRKSDFNKHSFSNNDAQFAEKINFRVAYFFVVVVLCVANLVFSVFLCELFGNAGAGCDRDVH
jgi:hypothetical protein